MCLQTPCVSPTEECVWGIISQFLSTPLLFLKIMILFHGTAFLCWLVFVLWFAMTSRFSFLVLCLCVSVCFQSMLFSLLISSSECTKFFGFKSSSCFPVWSFFSLFIPALSSVAMWKTTRRKQRNCQIFRRNGEAEYIQNKQAEQRDNYLSFFSSGNFIFILQNCRGSRYQTFHF